jgi:hypothetical protein
MLVLLMMAVMTVKSWLNEQESEMHATLGEKIAT